MVFLQIAILVFGFLLLTISAKGAIKVLIRLSKHFGLTEFTISFLVVGIVAIFPELSIGVNSALKGASSFGLGIVFGSNIADLTLITGLVAIAAGSIKLRSYTIKEINMFLLAAALPVLLLLDGAISRIDGIILLVAFVFYVLMVFASNPKVLGNKEKTSKTGLLKEAVVLLFFLSLLFFSGNLITDAARELSILLAVPIFFIGILIAVGTCLPELSFAIQASKNRHSELGFGDIFGNVVADSLATIGIIALINPIKPEFHQIALSGGVFMLLAMIAVLVLLNVKGAISRKHGFLLVSLYASFIIIQLLLEKTVVSMA